MPFHVLIVNVYFAPRSFGGGTIVAEQMAHRLVDRHNWAVSVFTSTRIHQLPDYALRRYRVGSVDVIAVNLPQRLRYIQTYRHPEVGERFADVLESIKPDVVHIHSIQDLGADLMEEAHKRNIPVAVTAHDAWWLLDRPFLADQEGNYIFQTDLSPERCRFVVNDYEQNSRRTIFLRQQLRKASQILFPSKFLMDLYLQNRTPAERSIINVNGVTPPRKSTKKDNNQRSKPIFGFVGGPGPMKGSDQILRAMRKLNRHDIHVKIVDGAQNLGLSWRNDAYWSAPGKIEFVPAYTQDTIDDFFSSIDVLLFPSQVKESFGLTVREALLRDVWVICTDAGGVVEDIHEGENGNIIPLDGGHKKLADRIEACLARSNWDTYMNPFKSEIVTCDQQAEELSKSLIALLGKKNEQ